MIKINKGDAPVILEEVGADLQLLMETNYDWYMLEIKNGEIKFEFTADYHSPEVKAALSERQHDKCCFSEAKFVGDFSHVEHFRPKGRVDIAETKERLTPGYYWLAYNWSNLFLCKEVINVSRKRNYFPLVEEANRNRDHHDTNIEIPLLIDPSADDPREHIKFEMDEPIHKSERGKATIKLLGLAEEPFSSARRRLFRKLCGIKESTTLIIDLLKRQGENVENPVVKENIEILKEAIKAEAEFSSMAIDLLQDWPPLQ